MEFLLSETFWMYGQLDINQAQAHKKSNIWIISKQNLREWNSLSISLFFIICHCCRLPVADCQWTVAMNNAIGRAFWILFDPNVEWKRTFLSPINTFCPGIFAKRLDGEVWYRTWWHNPLDGNIYSSLGKRMKGTNSAKLNKAIRVH